MTSHNRRNFLKWSCLSTGASLSFPLFYKSAVALDEIKSTPNRFFVQIQMQGGWDTSLSIDPWIGPENERPEEKDYFLEYKQDELIKAGSLLLGPAMEDLKDYGNDLCIINGVFMSTIDNGHGASSSYIMTASPTGTNPDLCVELNQAIPDGIYGICSNTSVQTKTRAQIISNTKEIKSLLTIPNPSAKAKALVSLMKLDSSLAKVLRAVASSSQITENLVAALKQSQEEKRELDAVEILRATFLGGGAATALIDYGAEGGGFLDTHSNHVGQHLSIQKTLWSKVANMIKRFKETPYMGKTLFDFTTFMVASEFNRTPALNAAGGKDHNPYTNSVVLFGQGIQGGQRIGRSKLITRKNSRLANPYLVSMPFDFKTEEPIDSHQGTDIIFPENVARTIAEAMKVDWGIFKSVAKETQYFKKALKS